MKSVLRLFLRGLTTALPIFVTGYILYWIFSATESGIGWLLKNTLVDEKDYRTGMGVVGGIVLMIFIGMLNYSWLARWLMRTLENLVERTPFVKSIYGMIKDVMSFVQSEEKRDMDSVVAVTIAGSELIGLVTRESTEDILGEGREDRIAVFLPMSYQLGGFTVFVPKADVRPLDMDVETGLRLALTAGVKSDAK